MTNSAIVTAVPYGPSELIDEQDRCSVIVTGSMNDGLSRHSTMSVTGKIA